MLSVLVALALAAVLLVAFVALTGVLGARPFGQPGHALPVAEADTMLDRAVGRLVAAWPGRSGLALVSDNVDAFAMRAASARCAGRSLDVQCYYWKSDLTGDLLAAELVAAADRGVRVRLLIDDINAHGFARTYLSLDRHRNIEVRLFNPTRCRNNALLRGLELILRFWSVNRRMHNKAWIVDGRLAIVGGRNVGDAYFDASEASNFRDMDLAVIGPAVEEAQDVFDRYWNCEFVWPIRVLAGGCKADLGRLRRRATRRAAASAARPYLERARSGGLIAELEAGRPRLHWTASARVVSDPPEKAAGARDHSWLLAHLMPCIASARKEVAIVSPYFIPLDSGARQLLDLAESGVSVSVLTNSLAATDVAAVHGAYRRYRRRLVAGGVRLFELRQRDAHPDISLFGSRGASLHTKAFVADGRCGFVGSFNFDPRSVALNTEMGLLFEHPGLAAEILEVIGREISPQRSYRLAMAGGRLVWEDGVAGAAPRLLQSEPEAPLLRRLVALAVGWLPLESQL